MYVQLFFPFSPPPTYSRKIKRTKNGIAYPSVSLIVINIFILSVLLMRKLIIMHRVIRRIKLTAINEKSIRLKSHVFRHFYHTIRNTVLPSIKRYSRIFSFYWRHVVLPGTPFKIKFDSSASKSDKLKKKFNVCKITVSNRNTVQTTSRDHIKRSFIAIANRL